MRLPVRLLPLTLVGVLGLGLVACSSEEPAENDETEAQSKILQPGRPGEGNETLDPDTAIGEPATNDTDVAFMQMMVPHHAQALEMSQLAQSRARSGQVVAISRRIKGAQGPEIVGMSSWLQTRDLEVPESLADVGDPHESDDDHGDHAAGAGTMAMHGMLSQQEMAALADSSGRDFDRLFVAGMIQHHEGAVAMAREEMEAGSDTLALELAADVAAGQQAEIRRLVDIRRRL